MESSADTTSKEVISEDDPTSGKHSKEKPQDTLDDIKARIRAEVFSVIESETVRTRSLRAALSLPGPSCPPCRAGGLTRPHATRPRTSGSQTRRARCS